MGDKPRMKGLSGLRYIGVGLSFGVFVGAGGYLGYLAEGWLHTGPWLRLVGIRPGQDAKYYWPGDGSLERSPQCRPALVRRSSSRGIQQDIALR